MRFPGGLYELLGIYLGEIVTAGQVVKALLLNGLGFISRALYLFAQFLEDKATEHLRSFN